MKVVVAGDVVAVVVDGVDVDVVVTAAASVCAGRDAARYESISLLRRRRR